MTLWRPLALLSFVLTLGLVSSLEAQRPNIRFVPGPKAGGGDIEWSNAPNGRVELVKDEYLLIELEARIKYQDITVRADKITHNFKTKDVVAEGHVIVDQGPSRLTASQAVYNINTRTGTFFNATATMDPSMYFSGDRIEKIDDDSFKLTNGVFTSCDLDRPAWSIHVGEATVNLDDYAYFHDLSFHAQKLPIFWAPRLVWPTKRERSQGLLIPRVLFSTRFGQRLELGYFIPFGESVDATVYADINTKQFFGTGLNLRYLPSQDVKLGELSAYAVNNPDRNDVEWKYQYQHAQENLPGGFRGVVDMQDYSDLDFFREYDRDPRLHTLSNIYSSAYLTKNRPTYSLNVIADRRDLVSVNTRQRFEQVPAVQYRRYPQRLGRSPLYLSLESSASQLRMSNIVNDLETRDADYFRADVFPTLSMQLRTPPWLSVKPQISLRQTWYSSSLDEATNKPTNDESIDRFYAQGQVEMIGPSFSRVYNQAMGGFSRFKHVIEPRVRYLYTTEVEEQDRIIRFDTVDTPYLPLVQDSVEYSLTQRILGKETGPGGNAREVLSLSLRQSVALSDPFEENRGGSNIPGAERRPARYTPLTASLRVNPYQTLTLDATSTFGNVSHQIDTTSVSANLVGTGDNADKYLSFTWFASFNQPGSPADGSSQIRINTGSSLLRDRLRADVELNFDAQKGSFLEQRFLTGWTGSCYGFSLEFRRHLVYDFDASIGQTVERPITSYGIAVTLKNVGTIGSH
ncbi:MAG TPA: LPS assembly protein LptD [Thermoanaerobaculia bacterium]|jgi:LPS-assembly protein